MAYPKVKEDFFQTPATTVVDESFFSDEPVKKKVGLGVSKVGGTGGSSKVQSNAPTYTPNTDQANPFSIGGQYNQPQKLDADNLDLLNTKHDAAIADQIKKYPLRKIP